MKTFDSSAKPGLIGHVTPMKFWHLALVHDRTDTDGSHWLRPVCPY